MQKTAKFIGNIQAELDMIDYACNPLGLINSMLHIIAELREAKEIISTDKIMHHPIVRYYMQKLCDMSGSYFEVNYARIYNEALDWANNRFICEYCQKVHLKKDQVLIPDNFPIAICDHCYTEAKIRTKNEKVENLVW